MATCKECFHWNACQGAIKMCNCKVVKASEGAEECENYLPTADVAEVVRCKDCRNRYEKNWAKCHGRKPDDFCSCGERKEGASVENW